MLENIYFLGEVFLFLEPESILLILAVVLLIIDLILIARPKVKLRQSIYGFYASVFSFALILISYFSFITAFVTNNFSLQAVYSYSSSSMPIVSKLYATWAGSGGSILLLITFTAITWFSYRASGYKKQNKTNFFASIILSIVLVFFIIAAIMMNPFARFTDTTPIEGRGLNPVLQNFWMAVHPPIIFSGYVLVLLSFALTLAAMKTGKIENKKLFNISVGSGWLLLTLGIALGGLWAYEVLGWGGYWSWDPVETASLLPWVALTIYFIVSSMSKNEKSLRGEFMILLAFSSLLFLSALTRGGLLQSIHVYGLSPAGPFLLLFAAGMIFYFFYLKKSLAKPLFSIDVDKSSLKSMSRLLALFSLIGIFLVCFLGIVFPMVQRLFIADAPLPSAEFYNNWNFPFVVGLVFALIGYSVDKRVNLRIFLALAMIMAMFSATFALIQWPTNNVLANVSLPLLGVGLFVGLLSLASGVKGGSLHSFGRSFVYLGIVVILIGVMFSATGKQVATINDGQLGSTVQIMGLNVQLISCTIYSDTNTIQLTEGVFPECSHLKLSAVISDGGVDYNSNFSVDLYTAYGLVNQPTIIRTGTNDIYIHLNATEEIYSALVNSLIGSQSQPKNFPITIEKIPMINLIWIGVAFLIAGSILSLIKEALFESTHRKTYFSKKH